MKERTEIRGDPHRIFIFSLKPLLGASEKISLEGGSGPGARVAVATLGCGGSVLAASSQDDPRSTRSRRQSSKEDKKFSPTKMNSSAGDDTE